MQDHKTPEKDYHLERLIFFSDGVFAIAITLLAIELRPPHNWNGSIESFIDLLAPKLIFYAISFFSIGMFWMAHRRMFSYVQKFSETASVINLVFLCLICLAPLSNALMGEYGGHFYSVARIYIVMLGATAFVGGLMWAYMTFIAKITDPRLSLSFRLNIFARMGILPPLMAGIGMWTAFEQGFIPMAIFLLVALLIMKLIKIKKYKDEPVDKELSATGL